MGEIIGVLISIGFLGFLVFIGIKDYRDRNEAEKQSLMSQIKQCKDTIRENKEKAEAKLKETERERIRRDIKLSKGYTYANDELVDIVMEYCPGKLISARSLNEMAAQIDEAKDDYDFDNFIKEEYLPIIGKEDFWRYHSRLLSLKSIIRLHKDLTPQDVIEQMDFPWQHNRCTINEAELLSCVKSLNLYFETYNDGDYYFDTYNKGDYFDYDEAREIAKLIAEHFDILIDEDLIKDIARSEDNIHDSHWWHHSPFQRSIVGIIQIFARVLFDSERAFAESDEEESPLIALDEEVFVSAVVKYFFYEVCYDAKKHRTYMPEIIDYVIEHRTHESND